VGSLEDLAPGETIYSARFMGDRGYLVTFKKVDPLFVIDLAEPTVPKVLGWLKITGYSDYLHPYDENHVIGIGKEAVPADEGDFAWYQGVKISLFDVTDVANPQEIAKYVIGDRGTESPVLQDHKALLFDRARNLLVLPVMVAEINPAQYPNGAPPNTYGQPVWQGAYVFSISLDEGLVFRGGITHFEEFDFMKNGYWSPYSVKRSLYIENVLYTISDGKVMMNTLDDLAEIGTVLLPIPNGK
ncbi:MAG: beta-propeller domain-containing protein, partial [Thermoplasmata archaeon]